MYDAARHGAAWILFLSLAGPATAGTILDFRVEQANVPPLTQKVYVANGKLSVQNADGRGTDLLYDRASDAVTMIDHSNRSFFVIDEQKIAQLAGQAQSVMGALQQQLAEQLQKLPPEQQAQMQEMLGGFGIGTSAPEPVAEASTTATTRSEQVAGYRCRIWQVATEGEPLTELCVVAPADIDVGSDDRQTLAAMQRFAERTVAHIGSVLGGAAAGLPTFGTGHVEGLAVAVTDLKTGTKAWLTGVTRADVAPDLLEVPAGYTRQAMPSLGL